MIKTILIGLGKVGVEYDFHKSKYKSSHFGAIQRQKKIKLVKLIDTNQRKLLKIKKLFSLKDAFFSNSIDNHEKIKADLVVIATTTENHEKNIIETLKYKPKLLICEKPLTYHPDRDKNILNLLRKKNVKLIVNYHRRFDARFQQLSFLIKNENYNKLIFKYGNGFLNYASHMLDFLIRTLGKIKNFKIIKKEKIGKDFAIDLFLEFDCGFHAHFLSFKNYKFDMFDLELYNKISKVEVSYGGYEARHFQSKKNFIYKNYCSLKCIKMKFKPFGNGFEQLYENVTNYFEGKKNLLDSDINYYSYLSSIMNKIVG